MSVESSLLHVPNKIRAKIEKIAKSKDPMKSWATEAREILQKAVEQE